MNNLDEYKGPLQRYCNTYGFGCRPILQVPNWFLDYLDKMANNKTIFKFNFGSYPNHVEFYGKQKNIESRFKKGKLVDTKKTYTNLYDSNTYNEYIYGDNYYIRMIPKVSAVLSDYKLYHKNKAVWFKVEPITWLYNVKEKLIISENVLFTLNNHFFSNLVLHKNFFEKDFNEYLNINFLNEIDESLLQNKQEQNLTKQKEDNIKTVCQSFNDSKDNNKISQSKFTPSYLNYKNHSGIYLTDINYVSNPAISREREIRELSKSLLIDKSGTILVGQPGVGKTAVVEGLAYKIRNGDVCDALKNKSILSINVGNLLAGTRYRGDFEEKITKLCDELSKTKNIILFIDEMHMTLGAGDATDSNIDMANILKHYISNNQIKMIGCTTNLEFEQYFSQDKAFRRRFNPIEVNEPAKEVLKIILKSVMDNLANQYRIKLNLTTNEFDYIMDLIIKYSSRPLKFTYEASKNPDASIKILNNCFAYMAIENLKEVNCLHFVNALKDNMSLALSEMEKNNLFIPDELGNNEVKEQDNVSKTKIIELKPKKIQ